MSFRNRCQIAGGEGVIDLSIPLAGGRDRKALMRDIRIGSGQGWQARHWKTILSCYSRSPWFEYYHPGLEALFRRPAGFLVDWNVQCFEWSLGALGMSKTIGLTEHYRKDYGQEGVDWRGKILPKNREEWGQAMGGQAGQAGQEDPGRQVVPRYRQVFEERTGFIPNLSILDLLFCEGREAIRYIQS